MIYILMCLGLLSAGGFAFLSRWFTNWHWYYLPIMFALCLGFFLAWSILYLLIAFIVGAICNIKKKEYPVNGFFQNYVRATMNYILFFTNLQEHTLHYKKHLPIALRQSYLHNRSNHQC